jgi:hypothetical protein
MLTAVVLAAYVSLGLALTVLHVPSVASSWKIWTRSAAIEQGYSPAYRRVFGFPRALKAVLFVAPLAVVYGIYLYPLVVLLGWPDPLGDYAFSSSAATDALAASPRWWAPNRNWIRPRTMPTPAAPNPQCQW